MEGQPIIILISAKEVVQNGSLSVTTFVYIENYPTNTTFNKGVIDGARWLFYPNDFGEVEMILPEGYTGNVSLNAHAVTSREEEIASRSGVIAFVVRPIPSQAKIRLNDGMAICFDDNSPSKTIDIDLDVITNEDDGSETLQIEISAIPKEYHLTHGNKTGNDSYILTMEDLDGLSIQIFGDFSPFVFVVTAITTAEEGRGEKTYARLNVEVDMCDGKPTQ